MIVTPLARASASSFSILEREATQRGRLSVLQICLKRSITKSAVVLGSAVTGLSSGGGGTFTLDHSSMMVWAGAGAPQAKATASAASDNRWRDRNMFSSQMVLSSQWDQQARAPSSARRSRRRQSRRFAAQL